MYQAQASSYFVRSPTKG